MYRILLKLEEVENILIFLWLISCATTDKYCLTRAGCWPLHSRSAALSNILLQRCPPFRSYPSFEHPSSSPSQTRSATYIPFSQFQRLLKSVSCSEVQSLCSLPCSTSSMFNASALLGNRYPSIGATFLFFGSLLSFHKAHLHIIHPS